MTFVAIGALRLGKPITIEKWKYEMSVQVIFVIVKLILWN